MVEILYPRLGDAQHAMRGIVVRHDEGDLLGRAQPRKESEFVVVALRFAPVPMQGGNECFGILDAEGINRRPIFFSNSYASQSRSGIAPLRVTLVSKLERTAQCADGVVVGLLAPGMRVCDLHQHGVSNTEQWEVPEVGTPDVIEDLSMRVECDGGEIASCNTRFLVREKMVEHVSAGLRAQRDGYALPSTIVRKFFREAKRTGLDLRI
jgi:hypothetical protein